ncbi:hypothetical protein [Cellulomonas sp. URHE0023]|uniref:hypothetical protein n=1 Tax=Cellulomonas sp. URHE0023 TaxID=1380354 RepID=UPI0004839ED4|nr:hypothetical protein [Cellulomonas sp. URHE0023]
MLQSARRLLSGALAVAALLTTLALPAAAADEPAPTQGASDADATTTPKERVTFGVAPAGPQRPDQRPYLAYTVAPGSVIRDNIAVINQADHALELDVYPSDVEPGSEGGLEVPARAVVPVGAGSWVSSDVAHVQAPAQTAQDGFGFVVVPFTVTIPTNAEPGDHVAAVVAALTAKGEAGAGTPALDLEQRVAARLYITVDGALAPGLVIKNLGASFEPGGLVSAGSVKVAYTLENTGNVRMKVSPTVRVVGPFGLLPRSADGERIGELLPGGEVDQTVTVSDVWPLVRLTTTVTAVAEAPTGGTDPGIDPVGSSTSTWAWPWLLVGLAALLILLAAWRAVRSRRRRRRSTSPGPDSRRGRRGAPAPAAPVAPRDPASVG